MEIIPTIVTILEIAAALTVLALVFSYIALKLRQKSESEEKLRNTKPSPRFPEVQNKPQIQSAQNDNLKHVQSSPPAPNSVPAAQITLGKKNSEKPMQPFKNKRIEVIDNLDHNGRTKTPDKSNGEPPGKLTNQRSLGDDILNKYDNNENGKLYSLKAEDKKRTKNQ